MPSIGLSCFVLGLAVASVTAINTTTALNNNNDSVTTATLDNTSSVTSAPITITSMNTINSTKQNGTETPVTTPQDDGRTSKITSTSTKPKPTRSTKPTQPTTTKKNNLSQRTTALAPPPDPSTASDNTGIIILVVIILIAVAFGLACYFARKRGRRYSADFTSRPDDTTIPLSTMEPDVLVDPTPQNGLQTFEATETTKEQAKEPEAKPEGEEKQKAETDKSEPSADSAAPAPSAGGSEDKPKEDVPEQSSPAPVEPNVDEKTDDESGVSNKTSVESLKETNENNSNNADVRQKTDLKRSNIFWDVPLNSPV